MANDIGSTIKPTANSLVQALLASADGEVLMIGGFVGQTDDRYIRLYADLSLTKYIEIARADVVRLIEDPDKAEQPSIIFFKSSAELRYVQTASFKAEQVVAAVASQCDGCATQHHTRETSARQIGPVIDVSASVCFEGFWFCNDRAKGNWQKFWCAIDYFACRLGSIFGPITV